MSQAIIGCSVNGAIRPSITGTKGISERVQRIGAGRLELTFDYPLAPAMYAVKATVTEPGALNAALVCEKKIDMTGAISGVEVKTFVGGMPADIDFDLTAFVFDRSP
ncbi:MAG TPA: hypothetical protein PK156_41415 [Polyangium sp.]|nr:hypothetical protein [Polyangium sp.]